MSESSDRRRRVVRSAVPAVGLVAAALLVWQGSYEAFSATTTSPANSWAAGTVALTNDTNAFVAPVGSAAFTVTKLAPGSTNAAAPKCVVVKSTTSVPSTGKLYFANEATTKGLDAQLTMKVESAAGQFANCVGYPATPTVLVNNVALSAAAAASTTYATGLGSWAIAGTGPGTPEYMTYRVTYTLSAAATNAVMGGTAAADFVWEADSN